MSELIKGYQIVLKGLPEGVEDLVVFGQWTDLDVTEHDLAALVWRVDEDEPTLEATIGALPTLTACNDVVQEWWSFWQGANDQVSEENRLDPDMAVQILLECGYVDMDIVEDQDADA